MSICPFGKYKGMSIENIPATAFVYLIGYAKEKTRILPDAPPGWTHRYPEFYLNLLKSITGCIICGENINRESENKHLRILCEKCYVKHENKNPLGKCKDSKITKQKNAEIRKIQKDIITECKLIDMNNYISNGKREQDIGCGVCKQRKYIPKKINRTHYNICDCCYNKWELNKSIKGNGFDNSLYSDYFKLITDALNEIMIDKMNSTNVTKLLTQTCYNIGEKLGFVVTPEKRECHPYDKYGSVFYDLELCNSDTKFIIEIDREYNCDTIEKMKYAKYCKRIWIRWGKITKDDIESELYDIIKIPLIREHTKWSRETKKNVINNDVGICKYFS